MLSAALQPGNAVFLLFLTVSKKRGGAYGVTDGNSIVISLFTDGADADGNPVERENILLIAAGHEAVHWLRSQGEAGKQLYRHLADTVRRLMGEKAWKEAIDQRLRAYKDPVLCEEEVVAQYIGTALNEKKTAEFAADFETGERNAWLKFIDRLKEFFAHAREAIEAYAKRDRAVAAALKAQEKELWALSEMLEGAVRGVNETNKNTAREGAERYSKDFSEDEGTNVYKHKKKRYTYPNNIETDYMIWSNSPSTPVGDVRSFKRFDEIEYYEKTKTGAIKISALQYDEIREKEYENCYRRTADGVHAYSTLNGLHEGGDIQDLSLRGNPRGDVKTFRGVRGKGLRDSLQGSLSDSAANQGGSDRRAAQRALRAEIYRKDTKSIPPSQIDPGQPLTKKAKVKYLTKQFKTVGWQGRPIVVVENGNNGYIAVNGVHRIYAARTAGIDVQAIVLKNNDAAADLLDNPYDEELLARKATRYADRGEIPFAAEVLLGREPVLYYRNYDLPFDEQERWSAELDAEYMDAVDRRDTETEQRMVDEAAERAGFDMHLFHGAKKGGGFTVFKDWQYFTENKAYAERYMKSGDPSSFYDVYVKSERMFDTRRPECRKIFEQYRREYGMSELQQSGLPDWTDGYDLSEIIEENDLPFDGIVLDEGGDQTENGPVSRGPSYVIRRSNQIKLADPITYDDDGNVIPVSERFDEKKNDIRRSSDLDLVEEDRLEDAVGPDAVVRENVAALRATAEEIAGLVRDGKATVDASIRPSVQNRRFSFVSEPSVQFVPRRSVNVFVSPAAKEACVSSPP